MTDATVSSRPTLVLVRGPLADASSRNAVSSPSFTLPTSGRSHNSGAGSWCPYDAVLAGGVATGQQSGRFQAARDLGLARCSAGIGQPERLRCSAAMPLHT